MDKVEVESMDAYLFVNGNNNNDNNNNKSVENNGVTFVEGANKKNEFFETRGPKWP